jgi:hypothetical protein
MLPCNSLDSRNITKLINFMGQGTFREANSRSASQQMSRLLWNLAVHYRVYKSRQYAILSGPVLFS